MAVEQQIREALDNLFPGNGLTDAEPISPASNPELLALILVLDQHWQALSPELRERVHRIESNFNARGISFTLHILRWMGVDTIDDLCVP